MIGQQGHRATGIRGGRSGCLRRRKITPSETSTNAKSVPIFERSASVADIDERWRECRRQNPRSTWPVRRLKFPDAPQRKSRQQPVARHREPDPRLAKLEDQQRREHAHHRAENDNEPEDQSGLRVCQQRSVLRLLTTGPERRSACCTASCPVRTSATPT